MDRQSPHAHQRRPLARRTGRSHTLLYPVLAAALVLAACAKYDAADNKYVIVFTPTVAAGEDSFAPIGILQVGETALVSLEVTPAGGTTVNRTLQAAWRLEDLEPDNDSTVIELALNGTSNTPYHTVTGLKEGTTNLCYTYQLPGAPQPMDDCTPMGVVESLDGLD